MMFVPTADMSTITHPLPSPPLKSITKKYLNNHALSFLEAERRKKELVAERKERL